MKLIEWGPNDQTTYEVSAAELRELVLECSVAYAEVFRPSPLGSTRLAEMARAKKFGTMIRKLTCR